MFSLAQAFSLVVGNFTQKLDFIKYLGLNIFLFMTFV